MLHEDLSRLKEVRSNITEPEEHWKRRKKP